MGDVAIRVQGLSKQYRIGKQERYRAFRDVLTDAMYAPFRRATALLRGNASAAANLNETIWALKDVSFEVKKGDVVGIIGRNGAGKSTLLKILSQITEPTLGRVDVYGRIGALLEVGTGFHQELTGRENIYLNGAILGMSRDEIRRKFDEIVAFAEVEQFIDTPVKHYSSGMGLRLGFAVAAHMEPEILIVDEVLAVGDAQFQQKCLGKIGEVARNGRTVLFVSHNMGTITSLCQRTILLGGGKVIMDGETEESISRYLKSDVQSSGSVIWDGLGTAVPGVNELRLNAARILNDNGEITTEIDLSSSITIEIDFTIYNSIAALVGFQLINQHGFCLFEVYAKDNLSAFTPYSPGSYKVHGTLSDHALKSGKYYITIVAGTKTHTLAMQPSVLHLNLIDYNDTHVLSSATRAGVMMPNVEWELVKT